MVTLIHDCGAECGIQHSGVALPSGCTRDTTTKRTGLAAWRFNVTTSTSRLQEPTAQHNVIVERAYVYFTSLPSANTPIVGSSQGGAWFDASESKIYAGSASETYGASGVSVTTGQWYRIDVRCDQSANPHLIDVQVDGAACGQKSNATAAIASNGKIGVGIDDASNATVDMYVDDWASSQTGADYPLGAGYVKSYIPNADGTHNVAGANDFEKTLTGTDITNATTDAYQLIDDRPLPTTAVDFINGVAPPNSTDYVEWQYEDSAEADAPVGVEAIVVHHNAGGAGTNNFTVTLREHAGGTSANIWAGTTNVGSTITYKRAHFATVPGTATAWTTTTFNALRSRFLVSDASPDPYIDAAMLEAAFPDVTVPQQKNWIRTGHVTNMYGVRPGSRFGRTW